MELTVETLEGDIRCIRLAGRMDLKGTQSIEARFNDETGARKQSVVVDMAGVSFIASIGIRLLLANIKQLNPAGAKIVFCRSQKLVEDVLRLSGLDAVAEIAADEAEAVKMLKGA
jgi:anti-sigma B factor antagonist